MKQIVSFIIVMIVIAFALTYFYGFSLVIDRKEINDSYKIKCSNNKVKPFEDFDFNSGDEWKMYVVFENSSVRDLPKELKKVNYIATSDIMLLNDIQKNWDFVCNKGDMTTVESRLVLLKNNEKVFQSGIVVNERLQGLQSSNLGWIESDKIIPYLKKFERSYFPVVFP